MAEAAQPDTQDQVVADALQFKDFQGYPKLASLMSIVPETAIFRRFDALALLNILRLQAELQDMEEELKEIIREDDRSGNEVRQKCSLDFRHMRDFQDTTDDAQQSLQHDHLLEIGKKLTEYGTPGQYRAP